MLIQFEPVTPADLKPGDLFSTAGPEYWNEQRDPLAVAEKVYVRTESPAGGVDAGLTLWRLTILGDRLADLVLALVRARIAELEEPAKQNGRRWASRHAEAEHIARLLADAFWPGGRTETPS